MKSKLGAIAIAVVTSWIALVAPATAGHVTQRALWEQGLTPGGGTGLSVPLGASGAEPPERVSAAAASDAPALRVYVIVIDGLRPQEVGPLTPTLSKIREGGTWYSQARAVLPGETLPNHAAMMTGVLPQRNGIVANQIYRMGNSNTKEYMQYPDFLERDTLTTRLERAYAGGISTATVLSKEYLYGLFSGEFQGPGDPLPQREADFHWDPRTAFPFYVDDPSDHAMDPATMNAFLGWVQQKPALPQFGFVNLGDVDRAGHADQSGTLFAGEADERFPEQLVAGDISAARQAAIESADTQIGRLVSEIEAQGAWDETVMIVLSDHGMDWGHQDRYLKTVEALTAAGYTQSSSTANPVNGDYWVVGGGGSELIYVHHKSDIAPIARILNGVEGVDFVATQDRVPDVNNPTLGEVGIDHPRSPEIEVFAEPGYRSSPASGAVNPLPGNHGHPVTQHVALLVGGGHSLLRDSDGGIGGETVFDRERNRLFVDPAGGPGVMSIASTVAAVFGIGDPVGGYAVPALTEAFAPGALGPGGGFVAGPGGAAAGGQGGSDARQAAAGTLTTTLAADRRRVGYGQRFVLSGRLTVGAACDGPLRVSLFKGAADRPGSAKLLATAIGVRSDRTWSRTLSSPTSAAYFARVQPTRNCEGSLSEPVSVPVRAKVSVGTRCSTNGRVSGRVLPSAPRTRVLLEARRGRSYRRVASTRLNSASRFSLRLPSCTGRHRVVWPSQGGRNLMGSITFDARRGKR